jgi:hypothetical protein
MIVLDGSEGITQEGKFNSNSTFGLRNRIFNGDMRIDQRNAGASVTLTSSATYVVDRWYAEENTDGGMTAQQDTSAPTGFVNSFKFTTTTADASLGSTQVVSTTQPIEGLNVSDLAWGTANAKPVTVSFWVRSSLTGTFGGSLRNSAVNRSYPFTYTISVADTWEYKTVTIAGDTSGTWLTTNGVGIYITFGLGVGSTLSGTAGAWNGNNNVSATGAVSVIGTLDATWYVTGVQLEAGSVATPFERRPFGTELNLCQRYFFNFPNLIGLQIQSYTTTLLQTTVYFPVPMRSDPTLNTITSDRIGLGGSSNVTTTLTSGTVSYRGNSAGSQQVTIRFTSSASLTAGLSYIIFPNAVDSGATFNSEL